MLTSTLFFFTTAQGHFEGCLRSPPSIIPVCLRLAVLAIERCQHLFIISIFVDQCRHHAVVVPLGLAVHPPFKVPHARGYRTPGSIGSQYPSSPSSVNVESPKDDSFDTWIDPPILPRGQTAPSGLADRTGLL
ncbi:hypothetical protein A0H81_14356 [Grifola frondosa]|uniref:Uncharacterized protein n=1 Tax=Grifola frondosa TaxID=5627 RepID=A0A1C7LP83_GRIFR|nr:hypothetical protein A0H81_14356 [Grifola frondosa]